MEIRGVVDMSGVLTLSNNDLLILRDVASQYYLQAGHDSDALNSVSKLISGNLGMLQPSVYFQVHETPLTGFWTITTVATGKWLKVDTSASKNQYKLSWVDTNPSVDFVIDKSPYYFSFSQVPGIDSPILYVLGSYYNGGMTLQQPEGAGSDPIFSLPAAIPGTAPEISFEVTVPDSLPSNINQKAFVGLDLNSPAVGDKSLTTLSTSSASSGTTTAVDGWAIAFIVLISVLALLILFYGFYMLFNYYTKRGGTRQFTFSTSSSTPAATAPAETSAPTVATESEAPKGGARIFLPYGGFPPP